MSATLAVLWTLPSLAPRVSVTAAATDWLDGVSCPSRKCRPGRCQRGHPRRGLPGPVASHIECRWKPRSRRPCPRGHGKGARRDQDQRCAGACAFRQSRLQDRAGLHDQIARQSMISDDSARPVSVAGPRGRSWPSSRGSPGPTPIPPTPPPLPPRPCPVPDAPAERA